MISIKAEINYIWWLLRVLFGVTFIGAGIDKFLCLLTDWHQFINLSLVYPAISSAVIVYLVGIAEVALGIFVFSRWVKAASLFIAFWMLSNGIYLMYFRIFLDTAARYCTLGLCALVLFHITRVREKLVGPIQT